MKLKNIPNEAVRAELKGTQEEAQKTLSDWVNASVYNGGQLWLCDSHGVKASLDMKDAIADKNHWNGSVFTGGNCLKLLVDTEVEKAAELVEKTFFRFGGDEAHFIVDISHVQLVSPTTMGGKQVLKQIDPKVKRDDLTVQVLVVKLPHTLLANSENWES